MSKSIAFCKLVAFCKSIAFLGMIVKEGAITVNNEKIEKILTCKAPTNLR